MPKIIENPSRKLMAEALEQVRTLGYSATTVRSVAKACGIGLGTLYNYFPSKDHLVAAAVLENWKCCIAAIDAAASNAPTAEPVARCIYRELLAFSRDHQNLFRDRAATATFAGVFEKYHGMLRAQLAVPFHKFCDDFTAEFVAEALLTWTLAGKSFEEIYKLLEKLF